MNKAIIWGGLLAFLILIAPVQAYSIDYYTVGNDTAINVNVNVSSLKVNPETTCSVRMGNYLSIAGTVFNAEDKFYSPLNTFQGYANFDSSSEFECHFVAYATNTEKTPLGYYDAQNVVLHSGDNAVSKFMVNYECVTTGANHIIFDISRTDIDDKGYYPMALAKNTEHGTATIYTTNQLLANYTGCQGFNTQAEFMSAPIKLEGGDVVCNIDGGNIKGICSLIYPFNSSASGVVNIFINATNETTYCADAFLNEKLKFYNITLIKASDNSVYSFANFQGECDIGGNEPINTVFNETFQLTPNELYFVSFYAHKESTAYADNLFRLKPPQQIIIQIDNRVPNYECGEWGECINGKRSRSCVDTTGVFPDMIEPEDCWFYNVTSELLLGFEESGDDYEFAYCFPTPGLNPLNPCPSIIYDYTVTIPKGWTFVSQTINDSGTEKNARYFGELTTTIAHSGKRSLELWSNPPKLDQPITVGGGTEPATCNFSTTANTYTHTTNLTNSIATESFTFPTPNAVISWFDKRDLFPKKHYEFGQWVEVCVPDKLCYGDCDVYARGRYLLRLIEINITTNATIRTVHDYYADGDKEAQTFWSYRVLDLSGKNITSSQHFRILIIPHLDQFDQEGNHIYIDDLKLQDLTQALNESECVSHCDPDIIDRYWSATLIINEDGSTVCEWTYWDGDFACILAGGGDPDDDDTIYDPPGWITDTLDDLGINQSTIDASGMGYLLNFVSPFFVGIMIIIIIGGLLEFKIAQAGGGGHGIVFAFVFLIGTTALTIFGIFPTYWGILMVIIGGLGTVFVVMKGVFGGR